MEQQRETGPSLDRVQEEAEKMARQAQADTNPVWGYHPIEEPRIFHLKATEQLPAGWSPRPLKGQHPHEREHATGATQAQIGDGQAVAQAKRIAELEAEVRENEKALEQAEETFAKLKRQAEEASARVAETEDRLMRVNSGLAAEVQARDKLLATATADNAAHVKRIAELEAELADSRAAAARGGRK